MSSDGQHSAPPCSLPKILLVFSWGGIRLRVLGTVAFIAYIVHVPDGTRIERPGSRSIPGKGFSPKRRDQLWCSPSPWSIGTGDPFLGGKAVGLCS